MPRSLAIVFLAPLLFPTVGHGQKANQGGLVAPNVPGYERRVIEGFTLLIHGDVIKNDKDSKLERKPLEVLELELSGIVRVMNTKALNTLRNVLIWVEWDEQVELVSGRKGTAVARYYGGHQLALLKAGHHPLKANNVSILNMKALTMEHQPKRDIGRCVILHEIAHAVHHQLIGYSNVQVKAVFQQAMERKLYDKGSYAATNEKEFFAELSCAYLDKMEYYPKNREDLKKHDPATFQLMETVWSKAAVAKAKTEKSSASTFALDATVDKVRLGDTLAGRKIKAEDLLGHPTLLVFWGAKSPASMTSLAKVAGWHKELADFGLVTVAAHAQNVPPDQIVAKAKARGIEIPIVSSAIVDKNMDFKEVPHCFLFDHTGQCIFRGDPFQAEHELRVAVGEALVAGVNVDTYSKNLAGYVDSLQKGKPPAALLQTFVGYQQSLDAQTKDQAKLLIERMTAVGQRTLLEAENVKDSDPVSAFLLAERLPIVFKATPVAASATKLLTQLKKNEDVGKELKARPSLESIRKLEVHLSGQPGAFDPMLPKFQEANKLAIGQMRGLLQQMAKQWPTTRATDEARQIAEVYGIKTQ